MAVFVLRDASVVVNSVNLSAYVTSVSLNYEVDTVSNGEAALAAVRKRRPDVVVTDFMMPMMTGLEFAEAVRADAALANLPIILVSGAQGNIARERPELFQAVFDKPYRNSAILEAIANHVATDQE